MKTFENVAGKNDKGLTFRFDNSFGPFIRILKDKQNRSTDIRVKFFRYLVKKFERQPQLLQPFDDCSILEQHHDLVQLLRMSLLPLASNTEDVPMALAFLQPGCIFYYTPLFKSIFVDDNIKFGTEDDEINNVRYFVKLVLEKCYHVQSEVNTKVIKQVVSKDKHVVRHYQIDLDSRFIEVHFEGEAPAYDDKWEEMLNASPDDFVKMFREFPSERFRLEGFCMLMAEDVSEEVAINKLKNAIVNMHTTPLDQVQQQMEVAMAELIGDPRLKMGISPFFKINGRVVYEQSFMKECAGIANGSGYNGPLTIEDVYERFSQTEGPVIFQKANNFFAESIPALGGLEQHEVKSFLIYPIKTRNGLIGAFEIGLPFEDGIDSHLLNCIRPAVPLITELINYMREMFDTRIERLVKEKFTPLQDSVEWKFNEVAWQYLAQEESQEREPIGNIVFENVFPLYGAVDIRNSTVERNLASKNDYLFQLNETLFILQETARKASIPLIESTLFKCQRYIANINDLLTSEQEMDIREFFENEVYVLFKHIAERDVELAHRIEDYMLKTDLEKGEFHKHHTAYEDSINQVNKSMSEFFEEEIKNLQKIYPFYFEKYKTDGVEYNMYIGHSIAPDKKFNLIFLKNLRAWQVSSMAYVTRMNGEICNKLPLKLQTTQLILVHGTAIDISFRKDEHRFDVEGAYNIRYEILKKRIDKVRLKGTHERLTQPGKIAIVYSNSSEIKEYLQHIHYLQDKGLLYDDLEMVDLENVQGVSGLKALRVGVKMTDSVDNDAIALANSILQNA